LRDKESGNISLLTVIITLVAVLLFLAIFDMLKIFICREETKKASEAICLAIAQDKLFFQEDDIPETITSLKNNCRLNDISIGYDEVYAVAEKQVELLLLDIFSRKGFYIRSGTKVKIIYPWEGNSDCQSYSFHY